MSHHSTSPSRRLVLNIIAGLRRILTRENLWALAVGFGLLLLLVMATSGGQPRFIYGNF